MTEEPEEPHALKTDEPTVPYSEFHSSTMNSFAAGCYLAAGVCVINLFIFILMKSGLAEPSDGSYVGLLWNSVLILGFLAIAYHFRHSEKLEFEQAAGERAAGGGAPVVPATVLKPHTFKVWAMPGYQPTYSIFTVVIQAPEAEFSAEKAKHVELAVTAGITEAIVMTDKPRQPADAVSLYATIDKHLLFARAQSALAYIVATDSPFTVTKAKIISYETSAEKPDQPKPEPPILTDRIYL
jgi:hypothetical protein